MSDPWGSTDPNIYNGPAYESIHDETVVVPVGMNDLAETVEVNGNWFWSTLRTVIHQPVVPATPLAVGRHRKAVRRRVQLRWWKR